MRQGSKQFFKLHPWKIIEDKFEIENNQIAESVFTLGNEYMGCRGFTEEGVSANSVEDCFLSGIYVKEPQSYGWKRKGFVNYSNSMVNTTNWVRLIVEVGGEKFSLLESDFSEYHRELDMKEGVLTRELIFKSKDGCHTKLEWERLVSYHDRHIGAIRLGLTALDHEKSVSLSFVLDSIYENHICFNNMTHCRMVDSRADDDDMYLVMNVSTSGQYYIHRMTICSDPLDFIETEFVNKDRYVACKLKFVPKKGKHYKFDKIVSAFTSRDAGYPYGMIPKESDVKVVDKDKEDTVVGYLIHESKQCFRGILGPKRKKHPVRAAGNTSSNEFTYDLGEGSKEDCKSIVEDCGASYDNLKLHHVEELDKLWASVDIEIEGDIAAQQGIRYCMLQLNNVYRGFDGYLNIGPKGYSSEHYWGRTFWDSESYCVPFYLFTNPGAAKKLIEYRYNTLDAARERAKTFDYKGAMYPMTTIDGTEDLNYWEYSFCEIHINSTIAYVVYLYDHVINDKEFLHTKGIELVVEIARFWASRGEFIPHRNGFGINRVIGPDEWQQFVNNNYYTNYMAKWVLEYAISLLGKMQTDAPGHLAVLKDKIALDDSEIESWQEAADKMILNYDSEMDVFIQDDMLLSLDPICREELDWEKDIPVESKWTIDKYFKRQLLKQPDIVLLMFLFRDKFTVQEKYRNYRFYEQRTAHGSSLSPSIHSIIASEIGVQNQAYDYYLWASRLDLENANNNTHEGLHISSMAGTWLNIVCGFGGMKYTSDTLECAPLLPEKWGRYSFKVAYSGSVAKVSVGRGQINYGLVSGDDFKGKIYDTDVVFSAEKKTVEMPKEFHLFRKPQAVIFDLDGVIVDTAKYHYQAWKNIADREGIYFDELINERLKGVSRMESLKIIMERSERNYCEQELVELAEEKNNLYNTLLDNIGSGDTLTGIRELIDSIKEKGLKVAICSASRNTHKILQRLGMSDEFDTVITGADVRNTKPDPEGFLLAAEKLNIQPENCVVIEDAFAGIEAASKANMRSIGIGDKCKLYNADYALSKTEYLTFNHIWLLF